MTFRLALFAAFPLVALTSVFACGSEEGSDFGDGDGGNQSSGASGTSGASGASGNGGFSSGSTPDGSNGGNGDGGACNASVARAEKLPVQMLILLDRSGSMGDHGPPSAHTNNAKRWTPITTALEGFLADPSSTGIRASLRYFPQVSNKATANPGNDIPANVTRNCDKASYATPDVALTPLPDAAAFPFADNATFYGTPTLPALLAAVDEATTLTAADASSKTVIVLVTDGDPAGCPIPPAPQLENTIENCAVVVANKPFQTYVIGVGNVTGLNGVAAAGGTGASITIDVDGTPAQTQAKFTEEIEKIRAQTLSCEVPIPAAPDGQTFDRDKVNVAIVVGETRSEIAYDPTCAGAGWKYDDAAAPSQIVLCPATCEPAKANPATQIDVAFGCTTRGAVN